MKIEAAKAYEGGRLAEDEGGAGDEEDQEEGIKQKEEEQRHGRADVRGGALREAGQQHHDGGGARCSEISFVMQGRAAATGKMFASPAKMHTTRRTSGTHCTNFKTVSAQIPKPSQKKIAVLKKLFEPSCHQPTDTFSEVDCLAKTKSVLSPELCEPIRVKMIAFYYTLYSYHTM